ncbi:probable thiopurine S-methyltransferase [Misgurnus anguillicaudatus]|uniref:probable thiopurine S-methyltransferase n=1 Tax=Misgurnus anguillicaudatus TaxID=75329 RepID=UPI003CCF0EB4
MSAQANRVMALSEWEDRWQEGKTGFFHKPCVHQLLENNLDKIVCGRKGIRFFFPLCGKAVDMKWLADMGHTVVGVEFAVKAIKQFFEEHDLTYSEELVSEIPGVKVFKSTDGKISIYQCDLYKFSSAIAGRFGEIWDRGALVAINPCDRQKYASLLISLMESDCKYLLDTLEYNPELYKGPPFLVTEGDVKYLFDVACDIELLQTVDGFEERHRSWGIDSLTEKLYFLTPKKQ